MNRKAELVKRIRRVSRSALYFSMKQRYKQRRRVFIAFESLTIAAVIVLTAVIQVYFEIKPPTYSLDASTYSLIGESRDDTAEFLKKDPATGDFTFEVPSQNDTSDKIHSGRNAGAYSAALPKEASDGVRFTDTENKIDITLKPKFKTYPGQKVEGDHVVYLGQGGIKLVYTLKYNGLKEDIILPHYVGDELTFDFELALPTGVEARLDNRGNIGIYSSDPTLFGDISFGSDDDRARVDKARESSEKTNLVATIPFPIIKDATGKEHIDRSEFVLGKKTTTNSVSESNKNIPSEVREKLKSTTSMEVYPLSVKSRQLKGLTYPVSIDPTVQTSSMSGLNGVSHGGDISINPQDGVIRRSPLTGGALNNWTTDSRILPAGGLNTSYVYNGRIYWLKSGNNIRYAPINSDKTIGVFVDTGVSTSSSRYTFSGKFIYAYFSGSWNVAQIRSNGSVSSFTATTSHASQYNEWALATVGNYIYLSGGGEETGCPLTCSQTNSAAIQYAEIYADGTLSAWASAGPNFTGARRLHAMPTYNGYLYITGGWQGSGGSGQTTVNFTKPNSNGTITSWQTTTSSPTTNVTGSPFIVLSGYLYRIGSFDAVNTVHYVEIFSDGSLGTWRQTTNINTGGRGSSSAVAYNGTLYLLGGVSNSGGTHWNDIQYTTPHPAGAHHGASWTATTSLPNTTYAQVTVAYNGFLYSILGVRNGAYTNTVARATINSTGTIGSWTDQSVVVSGTSQFLMFHSATVYNGYMYVFGGLDGGNANNPSTKAIMAPINTDGTLGTWANTTVLPTARDSHATVALNGYMYLIGGFDTARISNVHYATINASNGTLGTWTTTSSLPYGNYGHMSVIVSKYVYLVGGSHTTATVNDDVLFAEINTAGTLGTWTETTNMPDGMYRHSVVTYNGYIYVLGGVNQTPSTKNNVYFAPVNSDGTITAWAETQTLNNNRSTGAAAAYNGYMYLLGGSDGTSYQSTVEYQIINNGGTGDVSSWTADAGSQPGTRRYHKVVAYNGYIYALGGCTQLNCEVTGSQTGGVQYAPLNNDGSVGTWANTTGFAERMSFAAVALNGYMFISGGTYRTTIFNTLTSRTDMLYAPINSDGTIGAFQNTTSISANVVITDYHSTLYAVFGNGVVNYAKPTSSGTISAWSTLSHTMQVGTYETGFVVANNYFYRICGCTSGQSCDATNTRRDVEFAPLDPTSGNSTAAFKYTTAIDARRYMTSNQAVFYNGYILLPPDGGPGTGELFYAPQLNNGELGQWAKGIARPTNAASNASTIHNGVLYSNGGVTGGAVVTTTHYGPIKTIPRIGTFSKSYDFETGVKPTKLVTRGSKNSKTFLGLRYENNLACSNTGFDQPQSISNIGLGGANMQTINIGASRTLTRCFRAIYTLDDTQAGVFPDGGNETYISDFDLYFTANPGQRLRGGRTFTNGADRGLDAQP